MTGFQKLQQFMIPGVCPMGRQQSVGSYGNVEELEVNGLLCKRKRLYKA